MSSAGPRRRPHVGRPSTACVRVPSMGRTPSRARCAVRATTPTSSSTPSAAIPRLIFLLQARHSATGASPSFRRAIRAPTRTRTASKIQTHSLVVLRSRTRHSFHLTRHRNSLTPPEQRPSVTAKTCQTRRWKLTPSTTHSRSQRHTVAIQETHTLHSFLQPCPLTHQTTNILISFLQARHLSRRTNTHRSLLLAYPLGIQMAKTPHSSRLVCPLITQTTNIHLNFLPVRRRSTRTVITHPSFLRGYPPINIQQTNTLLDIPRVCPLSTPTVMSSSQRRIGSMRLTKTPLQALNLSYARITQRQS